MKLQPKAIIGLALLLGFAVAFILPESLVMKDNDKTSMNMDDDDGGGGGWACPMFCVVMDKKPQNSLCPVCGMELGRVASGSRLSSNERVMIGLEVATIRTIKLERELILYGEVDYDETRLSVLSARTSGWIEKLTRKVTWEEVKAGDILYELYAPELFEAQQEFLAAQKSPDLLSAARQRLSLLGLDQREIDAIEKNEKPSRTVARRAPKAGVIVSRNSVEGAYVKRGAQVFGVADLSRVWVQLEVFEPDLRWLAPQTNVALRDVSLGADSFIGKIVFADPVVDRFTRTARVRVEVENRRKADGRWALLPGQRIEAKARIAVNQRGVVVANQEESEPVLALPRTSVLRTGKRAVVYVLYDEGMPDDRYALSVGNLPSTVGYTLVEVEIGPLAKRSGSGPLSEFYPLLGIVPGMDPDAPKELIDGMIVATKGAFLIDSQAQLSGKPSLLFPGGRPTPMAAGHENH